MKKKTKKIILGINYGNWNKNLIDDFRKTFGIEDFDKHLSLIGESTPKCTGIKLYSTIEWGHREHWDIQPDEDKTQLLINWINKNFNQTKKVK